MTLPSKILAAICLLVVITAGCTPAVVPQANAEPASQALAVESFLADLAQNVAGDRMKIETIIPLGLDPHAFEPTPKDVVRIADSKLLIVNGAGFEEWLEETLQNAGGQRLVVEASAGLAVRQPQPGEHVAAEDEHAGEGDPHFWFDPTLAMRYVENIRDGLIEADPAGKDVYTRNAAAYIEKLKELDAWIAAQIAQVPGERRLMVTNHESFGYFADRYELRIVGTVLPGTSSLSAPSAAQMAALTQAIRSSQAPAIFIETGANPELATQIAEETGVRIVADLFTHSLSEAGGPAATYLDMMRYNTERIVAALQ